MEHIYCYPYGDKIYFSLYFNNCFSLETNGLSHNGLYKVKTLIKVFCDQLVKI